jgi:hemerythrin-like metal-binding protein
MDPHTAVFLPENLVVDIELMDDQHASLFSRLVALKAQCIDEGELPKGSTEELLDFLRDHCATEENLALEAGLDFSRHAEKHANMLRGMEKALHDLYQGRIEIFGLLRYIGYWLERHIADEDRHLAVNLHQANHWRHEHDLAFRQVPFSALPPHAVPADYSRL